MKTSRVLRRSIPLFVLFVACYLLSTSGAASGAEQPSLPLKAGIIGMDAHALPWTKIINDPKASGELADLVVVAGYFMNNPG